MPFELCNTHGMMNDIVRDLLHKFVAFYLDDVCVYNRTLEEHLKCLRLLL
jgi:hypothetical protein